MFQTIPVSSCCWLLATAEKMGQWSLASGESATNHIRSAESRGVDIDRSIADSVLYEILVGAPVLRIFKW